MKFIELFEDMINENVYSTTFLIPFPFSVFPLYFTHFYLFPQHDLIITTSHVKCYVGDNHIRHKNKIPDYIIQCKA